MSDISMLPSDAQKAAAKVDTALNRGVNMLNLMISQIEDTLNKSVDANKKAIASADIIAAGGSRYANLLDMLASAKATVNFIAPGSYPTP
jgi:chaperonin GroEL (HSP60 family)